ncbi:ATP-dependent RNA helicase [Plasmodium gonderi]|uniref:RNA helicase n=1 Tax=Plasmodium gonderi TaxID=77519 RepID=A0A1Y1JIK3_PLAGO|nr:ATP-dependent RNA helicase [Plasmodium gonderi]GAW81468.1 ATP-dependent RNA helicase [Plasmodium gonderi]
MSRHYENYKRDRNNSILSSSKRKKNEFRYDNHERKRDSHDEESFKSYTIHKEETSEERDMQYYRKRIRQEWGDRVRLQRDCERVSRREWERERYRERRNSHLRSPEGFHKKSKRKKERMSSSGDEGDMSEYADGRSRRSGKSGRSGRSGQSGRSSSCSNGHQTSSAMYSEAVERKRMQHDKEKLGAKGSRDGEDRRRTKRRIKHGDRSNESSISQGEDSSEGRRECRRAQEGLKRERKNERGKSIHYGSSDSSSRTSEKYLRRKKKKKKKKKKNYSTSEDDSSTEKEEKEEKENKQHKEKHKKKKHGKRDEENNDDRSKTTGSRDLGKKDPLASESGENTDSGSEVRRKRKEVSIKVDDQAVGNVDSNVDSNMDTNADANVSTFASAPTNDLPSGKEENGEHKLSRLERLKRFAQKIKKKGNDEVDVKLPLSAKTTKFTLNMTRTHVGKKKKLDLDIFQNITGDADNVGDSEEEEKKKKKKKKKKTSARKMNGTDDVTTDSHNRKEDIEELNTDKWKEVGENDNEDALELFMRNLEKDYADKDTEKVLPNQTITLDEIYNYDVNMHKFEGSGKINSYKNEGDTSGEEAGLAKPSEEAGLAKPSEEAGLAKPSEEAGLAKPSEEVGLAKPGEEADLTKDQNSEEYYRLFIEALKKKTEDDIQKETKKDTEKEVEKIGKEKNGNSTAGKSESEEESIDGLSEDSEFNIETNTLRKVNKKLLQVNHDEVEYLPIKKNIYVQVSEITNMKESDVEMFRKNNGNIIVRGKNCPRPVQYFYQCGLPSKILQILERKNFKKMFSIQMQTIPALMCGRDVIAIAETGSGKTLSYLFPLMRHVLHQPPLRNNDGPIAIILTPTRELSKQVKNEAKVYCKAVNLKILAVYGGSNIGSQLNSLKRGVEILVGTPGRIIDILTISNCKVTNLNRVSFVVLDEADRLLDLGFESQIHSILNNCRKDKQTVMISATFPNYIQNLAKKLLYKPIEIIVGEKGKTNNNIYQFVQVLEESQKIFHLLKLLGEWASYGLILIFVNKQLEADVLYLELFKYDYKTLVLHGGQDQADREFTLQNFKEGKNKILIATSVMARGIDIKNIIVVINYQCPDHIEDYIHRIGRTGRSNSIGYSYTFITPNEHLKAYDIYNLIKNNIYYINKTIDIPLELETLVQEYTNSTSFSEYKKKGYTGKGYKFTPNEKSRLQIDKAIAKKELGLVQDKADNQPDVCAPDGELDVTSAVASGIAPALGQLNGMATGAMSTHVSLSSTVLQNQRRSSNQQGSQQQKQQQQQQQQQPPPPPPPPPPGEPPALNEQNDIKRIELEIQRIKMNDKMDLSLKAKTINELMKTYNFVAQQQKNMKKNVETSQESEIEKIAEKEATKASEHIKDEKERQLIFNRIKEDVKKKLANSKVQTNSKTENIHRNMLLNSIRTRNMKKYSPFLPHTYVTEDNTILEEFYINDYPQHVRLKICNRDVLARISDMSGARCQIKGQYSNPAQPTKTTFLLDSKQLHIEITASTYNQVQIARNEFTSLLNQFLQKCNVKGHRKG